MRVVFIRGGIAIVNMTGEVVMERVQRGRVRTDVDCRLVIGKMRSLFVLMNISLMSHILILHSSFLIPHFLYLISYITSISPTVHPFLTIFLPFIC